MSTEPSDAVIASVDGRCGHILLNRPATLNALTLEMVQLMDAALDRFEADDDVETVVIAGAGDRALCAGGDITSIYESAKAGDPAPRTFWAEEYHLNARIARYPKPIVSLMTGIVMGGGVGISAHASHRVVTERSTVAMPEVGIGFAPDVGGTWLLSRAPGEHGTYLALTAGRVGPADAISCGLADHHVPADAVAELLAGLAAGPVDEVIASVATSPGPGQLDDADWIDSCFATDDVAGIVDRLRAHSGDAADAADEIATNSPTSLVVTLRALRQARALPSLEACLDREYRISTTFLDTPDFIEGIRAAIVDKDRNPTWDPGEIGDVDAAAVDRFFAPRPDDLHLAGADSPEEDPS